MKVVTSTDEYTIYQRRDGRYAVVSADKQPVNGDAKVAILLEHDLIKAAPPKAPEPEPEAEVQEAAADAEAVGDAETAEEEADSRDEPADEAAAEDASEDTEKEG